MKEEKLSPPSNTRDELDELARYKKTRSRELTAIDYLTLSKDDSELVRRGIAENEMTPHEILLTLVVDICEWVRLSVISAGFEGRSEVYFRLLRNDPSRAVREEVAINPLCPLDLMQSIAEGKDQLMRRSLAQNHAAPKSILEILARDEDYEVAELAGVNMQRKKESLRA